MQGALVDVEHVKYNITREALQKIKCEETTDNPHAKIVWWDGFCPLDEFSVLLSHQRINKIPNMDVLCYKSSTFQALMNLQSLYPSVYTFFPKTFLLPYQLGDFQRENARLSAKQSELITWIIKPKTGCSGNGIRLIQSNNPNIDTTQPAIIQRYVSPYLVSGHKFDFRLYIFIPTVEPFAVYLYNEGLARFCAEPYEAPNRANLTHRHSHLTNTAVNVDMRRSTDIPILQLASDVIRQIRSSDQRGNLLWVRIKQVVSLTMIAMYPQILKQIVEVDRPRKSEIDPLKRYFHILGIDIMLNEQMEPVVLELNDRPSLTVTFPIEHQLKLSMLSEAMNMVTLNGSSPTGNTGGWEILLPSPESAPNSQQLNSITMKMRALNLPTLSLTKGRRMRRSISKTKALPPLHPIYGMQ